MIVRLDEVVTLQDHLSDVLFVGRDELAACLNPKVGKLTVN